MGIQEIVDRVKKENWKSPYEWVCQDPDLFLAFLKLSTPERHKLIIHLSDQLGLKPKSHSKIGSLFSDLSKEQWESVFQALSISSSGSEHKWAIEQYKEAFGIHPFSQISNRSKLEVNLLWSDLEIINFILEGSGTLTGKVTLLFSSEMTIERKFKILEELGELHPKDQATEKKLKLIRKMNLTFQKYKDIPAQEIRRTIDSLLIQNQKNVEGFISRYLPILIQDRKKEALLYVRIKKGGLKPKSDKSNRPALTQEIYEGRKWFGSMVQFFEIEKTDLDEFPYLERVLRLLHLMGELYGESNWSFLESY